MSSNETDKSLVGIREITKAKVAKFTTALYSTFSFYSHINNVTRSANLHLRNINLPSLTPHATAILIHSLVTSLIDYCNSRLFTQKSRYKLQLVQDSLVSSSGPFKNSKFF